MACGVALKRSLDLHISSPAVSCDNNTPGPASKRRRYSIPQRCGSITSVTSTPPTMSPSLWRKYSASICSSSDVDAQSPFAAASKMSSFPSDAVVKHIYHEYKRLKKRKQLQMNKISPRPGGNQLEHPGSSSKSLPGGLTREPQLPSVSLDEKSYSNVVLDPHESIDTPLLTMRQVGLICERLLKEQESRLRSEYEKVLIEKLSEQYDAFVKFSHDQLRQQLVGRPASYVS